MRQKDGAKAMGAIEELQRDCGYCRQPPRDRSHGAEALKPVRRLSRRVRPWAVSLRAMERRCGSGVRAVRLAENALVGGSLMTPLIGGPRVSLRPRVDAPARPGAVAASPRLVAVFQPDQFVPKPATEEEQPNQTRPRHDIQHEITGKSKDIHHLDDRAPD